MQAAPAAGRRDDEVGAKAQVSRAAGGGPSPAAPVDAAAHGLEVTHRQRGEVTQPVQRVGKLREVYRLCVECVQW